MDHYLVTGAAGFIGSNIVRALVADGLAVRGVDNFSTGKRDNIRDLTDRFDLRVGDINDSACMADAMRGITHVFHQAALPSVERSVQAPLESHHVNATGTLAVLEAARAAGTVVRVVYAASSSAYGDTPTLPKVETMLPTPLSPYAVSKLAGEMYAQMYTSLYDLSCVCLRYFNVFGPYQDPQSRYAAVIPKFVQCVLAGVPPHIHGDGQQTRDFTYIDNVVHANRLAAAAPHAGGKVFNIACGERVTLLQLVEMINHVAGTRVAPAFGPARRGDVRDSVADIGAARQFLGYQVTVSVQEGLRRALHWYREHPAA